MFDLRSFEHISVVFTHLSLLFVLFCFCLHFHLSCLFHTIPVFYFNLHVIKPLLSFSSPLPVWSALSVLCVMYLSSSSSSLVPFQFHQHLYHRRCLSGVPSPPGRETRSSSLWEKTWWSSNITISNLGRNKQLASTTSPNLFAKAALISLIVNNGGGNREACLCKFPPAVISSMLNGQISGGASENNPLPSSFQPFVSLFTPLPPFCFALTSL